MLKWENLIDVRSAKMFIDIPDFSGNLDKVQLINVQAFDRENNLYVGTLQYKDGGYTVWSLRIILSKDDSPAIITPLFCTLYLEVDELDELYKTPDFLGMLGSRVLVDI